LKKTKTTLQYQNTNYTKWFTKPYRRYKIILKSKLHRYTPNHWKRQKLLYNTKIQIIQHQSSWWHSARSYCDI